MIRSYCELVNLQSFEDRFDYLKLKGSVGRSTFGFDRHINQKFYSSIEWRNVRNYVITRDNGCDLGVSGYDIHSGLLIHHINPIVVSDILNGVDLIFDPEFLITTTHNTHNAIHYGDKSLLLTPFSDRKSGDTKLW